MNDQDGRVRMKRRRRRRFAGLLAFLLAVLSAVAVLCLAMFFKVKTITVLGTQRYYAQDVVAVAQIYIDQNIFAVDTKTAAQSIQDAFPYVESVAVVRVLPTTIEIRITESQPALIVVNAADQYTLLSSSGRMIEQCQGIAREDLPLVVGADFSAFPDGSYGDDEVAETLTTLRYVLAALEEVGLEEINYIDVSDRLSTLLLYDNRVLLELGSETDLTDKLRRGQEILEHQLEEDYVGTLDLSIPNRGYAQPVDVDALINPIYREYYFKYE